MFKLSFCQLCVDQGYNIMYSLVFTINCACAFLFLFLGWASLKNTHIINIPKMLNYVDFSFGLTKFLKFKIQSLCFQVVHHIIFVVMYVCLYHLLKTLPCLFPLPTYMEKKTFTIICQISFQNLYLFHIPKSFEILLFIVKLKI
jgi:hypothetical protein